MNPAETFAKLEESHPVLAGIFKKHWKTPLAEFAAGLYKKSPVEIDPLLIEAFSAEWFATGYDEALVQEALEQLIQLPVLQTAHHLTPTFGPTFLSLDLTCLSGLPKDKIHLIGASSGVAFSNTAWSGALSYGNLGLEELLRSDGGFYHQAKRSEKERRDHGQSDLRISLIPSNSRDRLLFGTKIDQVTADAYLNFTPRLKSLIPKPEQGSSYARWSAFAACSIQQRIFPGRRFLIFDLNQVIRRYLVGLVEHQKEHPVLELLFDREKGLKAAEEWGRLNLFLGSYPGKKSFKIDHFIKRDEWLVSEKKRMIPLDPGSLKRELLEEKLCPGLVPTFLILRFVSGIRCLGSFNQVEYLESHRQHWEKLDFGWDLDLAPDHESALTTGRLLVDEQPLWPLDLAFRNQPISLEDFSDTPMKKLWKTTLLQLTQKKP